jgi:hypothetical protein
MEHEFNNRISAQRKILRTINRKLWPREALFGLSTKAIDRWVTANRLDPKSVLVGLVRGVSDKLFFLANKSQEQVSEQYRIVWAEIIEVCNDIGRVLRSS